MNSITYSEDESSEKIAPQAEDILHDAPDRAEPDESKAVVNTELASLSDRARNKLKSEFSPGDIIESRYLVKSVIGHGGFGCVYKVHQILLKKDFALKTLNPVHANETTILRLRKEAKAASTLEHPNLVRAFDFGMINDVQPFLVMELVEGRTLAEHLREHGKLSVETALQIFIPMAKALAYAHKAGVIHRDLKPSNIMLTADSDKRRFIPKIVDFGIAKTLSEDSHALTLTSTGDVFGTPLYMSPEQCAGTGVEARSDIYSLGCMLFEALTGAPPFGGRTALEVMMQHGVAQLPSLKEASLGETFAPQLEAIVEKMLAKLPENRYTNSADLAEDLFHFQQGDFDKISVSAREVGLSAREAKASKSATRLALIGLTCTLVGATIGYGIALNNSSSASLSKNKIKESTDFEPIPFVPLKKYIDLFDSGYFSSYKHSSRVFTFQGTKGHGYGKLSWWENNKLHTVPAVGTQTVPQDARIILSASSELVLTPPLSSRFRLNELYGVVFEKYDALAPIGPMSHTIRLLTMQENLQVLELSDKTINLRALRSIGDIPHLAWLNLGQNIVGDYRTLGVAIAEFKNLPNIHVLRLKRITDIGAVITKLAQGSAVRRLSLCHNFLSGKDIDNIIRLKSLEVLSLNSCDGEAFKGGIIEKLSKAKRLKVLFINASVLKRTSASDLRKLQGLTIITASDKTDRLTEGWTKILSNLSQCKVIDDEEKSESEGSYFDALAENPAPMEI